MRRISGLLATLVTTALLTPTSGAILPAVAGPPTTALASKARTSPGDANRPALPALRARRVVTGLSVPWDVAEIRPGQWLITERQGRLWHRAGGAIERVDLPGRIWSSGETGLMSVAIDPRFAVNRRFYTCQGGFLSGGRHDVRVVAWRLGNGGRAASRARTLLKGIPATSGRHGGCRLLIHSNGALLVGTGDAAIGRNPQRRTSLGGKVLRLTRFSGAPWPDNPWPRAKSRNKRYVLTYGHRNVQGLAERHDGSVWSAEHGPDRNDEVNRLVKRGNYGWNPVPGYNESVPMTDFGLPGRQIGARWRSGYPTVATSGATWVRGQRWGALQGTLAVAALKGSRLIFMKFSRTGRLRWTAAPRVTRQFGRLRSVTQTADGALLVTTSNGAADAVVRVVPR